MSANVSTIRKGEDDRLDAFTPGPWRERACPYLADDDDGSCTKFTVESCYREISAGRGYFDLVEPRRGFALTGYVSPADAGLLAAAWDLLAACRLALQAFEARNMDWDYAPLTAAIATAERHAPPWDS